MKPRHMQMEMKEARTCRSLKSIKAKTHVRDRRSTSLQADGSRHPGAVRRQHGPSTTGFNATHQVLCVQLKSQYKYTDSFLSDPRDVFTVVTALVSPAAGVKHLDEESLSKAAEFLC